MSQVSAAGWKGAVVHFRGCSGEANRLPRATIPETAPRSIGCCAGCAEAMVMARSTRSGSRSAGTRCSNGSANKPSRPGCGHGCRGDFRAGRSDGRRRRARERIQSGLHPCFSEDAQAQIAREARAPSAPLRRGARALRADAPRIRRPRHRSAAWFPGYRRLLDASEREAVACAHRGADADGERAQRPVSAAGSAAVQGRGVESCHARVAARRRTRRLRHRSFSRSPRLAAAAYPRFLLSSRKQLTGRTS